MTDTLRHARRAALAALGTIAALSAAAPSAPAQATPATQTAHRPLAVGEDLVYKATFGKLPVGSARMRIAGIESVRGRPAYHLVFTIDGGIIGFRVHDRYESWIDTATHASLRYTQTIAEGSRRRTRSYEIYPERAQYTENGDSALSSVRDPLDDGSFIYAVRAAAVQVGETQRFDRYFKPDRNPVILRGVSRDTVTVGAGTFATVVVHPSIKAKGIFAENGDARVWFTDDAARYPVKIATKFAKFSLTLTLASYTPGDGAPTVVALVADR